MCELNSLASPLGATVLGDGVNFSVFSRHARSVELLFFDRADDAKPARIISIDSASRRRNCNGRLDRAFAESAGLISCMSSGLAQQRIVRCDSPRFRDAKNESVRENRHVG